MMADTDTEKQKKPDALLQSWQPSDDEKATLVSPWRTSPTSITVNDKLNSIPQAGTNRQDLQASNTQFQPLPLQSRVPPITEPPQTSTAQPPGPMMGSIASMPSSSARRNGPLRIIGEIGRDVGSAVGSVVAPWAVPFIPGTIQHQLFQTGMEREGEQFRTGQEEAQARTDAERARAEFERSEALKNRRGETPAKTPEELAAEFDKLYPGDPNDAERQQLRAEYSLTGKFPVQRAQGQDKLFTDANGNVFRVPSRGDAEPVMTKPVIAPPIKMGEGLPDIPATPIAASQLKAPTKEAKSEKENLQQELIDAEKVLKSDTATPDEKKAAQQTVDAITTSEGVLHPLDQTAKTQAELEMEAAAGNPTAQKALDEASKRAVNTATGEAYARIPAEVKSEVEKAQALAPDVGSMVRTTMAGNKYVDATQLSGPQASIVKQQALEAGIPVVNKETANSLEEIDTAKQNLQYMNDQIGKKLAAGAGERLWYGPKNTLQKISQDDPDFGAIGTYRNAAIQAMRAVAGAKGLRINKAEVQLAIDNDIPSLTDTLPVAQAKLRNMDAFLNDSENSLLVKNRESLGKGGKETKSATQPVSGTKEAGKIPEGAIPGTLKGKRGYVLNGEFHAE
jgi:hypothetical protein